MNTPKTPVSLAQWSPSMPPPESPSVTPVTTFPCAVTFVLNEAGQKDALQRGGWAARKQTHWVNLPVTAEVLAEVEVDADGKASFDHASNVLTTQFPSATTSGTTTRVTTPMFDRSELSSYPSHEELVEAVLKRMAQRWAAREHLKREREQEAKRVRDALREVISSDRQPRTSDAILLNDRKTIHVWHHPTLPPSGVDVLLDTIATQETDGLELFVVDWICTQNEKDRQAIERAEAEKREHARMEQEKMDAERAQRVAAQKAGEAAMLQWIEEHGSERLKLLVSEGFQWKPLAHDEWVAANTPKGFVVEWGPDYIGKERLMPTLEELIDLNIYKNIISRNLCPHLEQAYLCWNVADGDHGIASLDLTIRSPLGETTVVSKFYEATRKPL